MYPFEKPSKLLDIPVHWLNQPEFMRIHIVWKYHNLSDRYLQSGFKLGLKSKITDADFLGNSLSHGWLE